MKIIVPPEVINAISKTGNITVQKNALKIYAGLYKMSKRSNKSGYFPMPSSYLKKINSRYIKIINVFIDNQILDYEHKVITVNESETKKQKSYNVTTGTCMKYKFLVDIKIGQIYDVKMPSKQSFKWFEIIKSSLETFGYKPKISRDTFGRRVHHPIIRIYKTFLANKGYAIIDAECSQPRLLLDLIKENNIYDKNYENAFKNDFYTYIMNKLKLKDRNEAKKLFMFYLNSNGYVPNPGIYLLFPEVSNFIKKLKKDNYKNLGSIMQRKESEIWIDNLLTNIPSNFALPIHDCLIVRESELNKILIYCQKKYPKIVFTTKIL